MGRRDDASRQSTLETQLTRDPIGYTGGINLYAYCGNNPVNRIDPSGLQMEEPDVEPDPDPDPENGPCGEGPIAEMAENADTNIRNIIDATEPVREWIDDIVQDATNALRRPMMVIVLAT